MLKLFPNANFILNKKEMKESKINSLFETYSLLLEDYDIKMKQDWSGAKWGAVPIGARIYEFSLGSHKYILKFVANIINDKSMTLAIDLFTKKSEFKLVKVENPVKLLNIINLSIKDTLIDLKKWGFSIEGLDLDYKKDVDEEGNLKFDRPRFFSVAVERALRYLGINFSKETNDTPEKTLVSYEFSESFKEV
jgi:hypothetical protein